MPQARLGPIIRTSILMHFLHKEGALSDPDQLPGPQRSTGCRQLKACSTARRYSVRDRRGGIQSRYTTGSSVRASRSAPIVLLRGKPAEVGFSAGLPGSDAMLRRSARRWCIPFDFEHSPGDSTPGLRCLPNRRRVGWP